MTHVRITRAEVPLRGTVRPPADKSISHRAVLFAAMAEGTSVLTGVLDSADVRATLGAVEALGARLEIGSADEHGLTVTITGWGSAGPVAPATPIDCGNSGTTVRLLMGVLAGWPVEVMLTGDDSLSQRPMRRVGAPLAEMGAHIETSDAGTLPARIAGGGLSAIRYHSPVASAQVKSAVLLAGLRAEGTTTVVEPVLSRDHTERLLPAFGVPVAADEATCAASVTGPVVPRSSDIAVAADPSSAAFLAAAAVLVPGSEVRLPDVTVNPTRTGFFEVLQRMGADITIGEVSTRAGEPVATLIARHTPALDATIVRAEEVPALIDEVPVLAVVTARARGVTRFEGVGELRVKESDRLEATRAALSAFGVPVRAGEDWLEVTGGGQLRGARVPALGDHRLAMAWAVAGLLAHSETVVEGFDAVTVSYPRFADDLRALGACLETV